MKLRKLDVVASWATLSCLSMAIPLAPAQAEEASARPIEEIIVTSRRQAESQQSVPVAVTAFTEEDLDRIAPRTLRDIDGLMPNVFIGMNTAGPSAGAIFIRGLGYADIEKTQSPQVAVIVDGIYQGTNTGQLIDMFDVARIEVNRGPQGVLYGKNTSGGTIVVERVRPDLEKFGAALSGQLGNYDERQLKGRVNVPLIEDTLGLKIGALVREREGYYDNLTLGGETGEVDYGTYTASLLWQPIDSFSAQLTYDLIEDDGDIPPQDPRYNGDDPFDNEANIDEFQEYDVDSWGLQIEWDLGFATLRSITGLIEADDRVLQDFDGSTRGTSARPLVQLHTLREQEYEQFSQEVLLLGEVMENVTYTVGAYFFDSELDFHQGTNQVVQIEGIGAPCTFIPGFVANPVLGNAFCQLGPLATRQESAHDVESYAYFGGIDWQVTEQIEISAGVRYIEDEKDFSTAFFPGLLTNPDLPPTTPAGPAFAGFPIDANDSWDDVITKLTGTWQITENNMVYASFGQGFRSGGFSVRGTDPNRLTYEPEEADSYEVGTKNDLWDGRVRLNLAAFYTQTEGAQYSAILVTAAPPGTNTLINNAGDTEIYGGELELIAALTDSFTMIGTFGYQDAEAQEFSESSLNVPFNVTQSACNPVENPAFFPSGPTGPNTCPVLTFSGGDIGRAPDWNWSLTGIYHMSFGQNLFTASLTARGQDDFVIAGSATSVPVYEQGYTLWDARVSYEWNLSEDDLLRLSVVGKNLGDEEYLEQALPLGAFGGFQGWGPPRTVAVELLWQR